MKAAITAVRRPGPHNRPAARPSSREGMSHARRRAKALGNTRYAAKTSAKRARSRNLCAPALANRSAMPKMIKYPSAGSSTEAALGSDHDGRCRADMWNGPQCLAGRGVVDVEVCGIDEDAVQQRVCVARELDRRRHARESELLYAPLGRQIEHPDILARIFVRLDAATMHDRV